jgi:hypothetical protein
MLRLPCHVQIWSVESNDIAFFDFRPRFSGKVPTKQATEPEQTLLFRKLVSMNDSASEEGRRIVQEIAGRFGPASFMRRAKLIETTWARVLEQGDHARREQLAMVRLRVGQLHALAGGWDALRPLVPDDADRAMLAHLHDELQPDLRMPLEPTTSVRTLRGALRDLIEAMQTFNARWQRWLAELDLTAVNKAREDYNRYYVIEKECALGSAVVARRDFKALPAITRGDVEGQLPLLTLPRVAER